MVVLSIDTHSSEHTVYFDSPIPKPRFVSLLSCSLYNSWHNLTQAGSVAYKRNNAGSLRGRRIVEGNFNFETLADILAKSVANPKDGEEIPLKFTTHGASAGIVIEKAGSTESFTLDKDLANILQISEEKRHHITAEMLFIPKLNSPDFYHIHCDLVDPQNNLYNGRPSELLEIITITGKAYEKVTYHQPNFFSALLTKPLRFVSSLTVSVRDQNGELFDFNEMPLHFKIRIN